MSAFTRYVRAHHVGLLALFIALGGTSYAAVMLPANSVGTRQIKKRAVTSAKIKKDAVTSAKVDNGSLREADFAAGELPAGRTGPAGPQGTPGPKGDKGDTGDSFVPHVVKRFVVGGFDSSASKTTVVECPLGTVATGGYAIEAPSGAPITVTTNHDQSTPDGEAHPSVPQWIVTAHEIGDYAGAWQLQVFVNCVG